MPTLTKAIPPLLQNPARYSAQAGRVPLRAYQIPPIQAIARSIRKKQGLSFVVIFPRQSGKNETQLSLYSYLLTIFQQIGGDIIHVEPTYKPQTQTAMARLELRLQHNALTRGRWKKRFGYVYQIGQSRIVHLSGDESANVVGGTAGLLLSINEAQDISQAKFDKDFLPMAASTNATRVFWGTRWTSDTLLERELKQAREAEARDGIQRVFFITADDVGKVHPPYKAFVDDQVLKRGRNHPLIKTQFFCELIDAEAGMFPPYRIALLRGDHPAQDIPTPGKTYIMLIDCAGQDEMTLDATQLDNPARDALTVTLCELDFSTLEVLQKPTYRTIARFQWFGEKHVKAFGKVCALQDLWHSQHIVIDATGVGEGLFSMLQNRYGESLVLPIKFTEQVKSQLGYGLIAIVETGRLREYAPLDDTLLIQLQNIRSEARPGPSKALVWGVPNGKRAADGAYLHDDFVTGLAQLAIVDQLEWSTPTAPIILNIPDDDEPTGF